MAHQDWWKDEKRISRLIQSLMDPVTADHIPPGSAFPNEISEDFFCEILSPSHRKKISSKESPVPLESLLALQAKLSRLSQIAQIRESESKLSSRDLPSSFQPVTGEIFERMNAFNEWLRSQYHVHGWLISKFDSQILGSSDLSNPQIQIGLKTNVHVLNLYHDGLVPLKTWNQGTVPLDTLESDVTLTFLYDHHEVLGVTFFLKHSLSTPEVFIYEASRVIGYVLREED